MVKLRVLITGAQGQLGQALLAQQPDKMELIGCSKGSLDITDIRQVERVFLQKKPHVIINCAAYTAVDKAEENQEQTFEVNEQGVKNLVKVCKRKNIKLVQISTDYVFGGDSNGAYSEVDNPAPINVYGQSKLAGEQALSLLPNKNALIVRSSWLISALGHNFFKTIIRALQQEKPLQIVNDQRGTPTNAHVLAGWIITALPLFWQGKLYGLYHAAASNACSWYELASEIQRLALKRGLIDFAVRLTALSSVQYQQQNQRFLAPRPSNSALSCGLFLQALHQPAQSWQDMLNECFSPNHLHDNK